jgi:hypothetical protein
MAPSSVFSSAAAHQQFNTGPTASQSEISRKKMRLLRSFERMETRRGLKTSTQYSMDSSLEDMQREFDAITDDITRAESIKTQGQMLLGFVQFVERANTAYDPVGLMLDGWYDAVSDDITSYDDVFSELHDRYGPMIANIGPEIRAGFRLTLSAAMVHGINSTFAPGGSASGGGAGAGAGGAPGTTKFIQTMMSATGQQQQTPHHQQQQSPPPQPPMPAYAPPRNYVIPESYNASMSMPEDIYVPRGQGPAPPIVIPRPDLIASNKPATAQNNLPLSSAKTQRRDMRGPDDLADILANTRTKTIQVALDPELTDATVAAPFPSYSSSGTAAASYPESSAAAAPITAATVQPKRGRKRKDQTTVSLDL